MIYEDRPLQQEAVKTSRWEGRWDAKEMQKGVGVLMEGVFHKRVKHLIQDSTGTKHRFLVFHVEFKHGCQRRFDAHGREIEPNFGQTGVVRTGYLHSSYKMEAKGTPDILDFGELSQRIQSPLGGLVPPLHAQTLCFWGEEQVYEHVEMDFRQPVRLKTRGDCPLIESLTRLDTEQKAHSASYAGGERAGQSWTDRVMGVKSTQDKPQTLPQDQLEGVADDEWDD